MARLPRAAQRGYRLVFEDILSLRPGQEWYLPIGQPAGRTVSVRCSGDERFYAGLFTQREFSRRKGAAFGMFSFPFGSDRFEYSAQKRITRLERLVLVIRVGAWSRSAEIEVRVGVTLD